MRKRIVILKSDLSFGSCLVDGLFEYVLCNTVR